MIKIDDNHFMCFLYYVEEHDDMKRDTTLKRIDTDYLDFYKSTVMVSYRQFEDYLKQDDYHLVRLYFNNPEFIKYFERRCEDVNDSDDFMFTSRLYEEYLYNTIITINTIDKESLGKVKLKHGAHYHDDLYEEDYEVIMSFIHHECTTRGMNYQELRDWILNN